MSKSPKLVTISELEHSAKEYNAISRTSNATKQALLDIEDKQRTSLFPWKGQFSPQLIDHILHEYSYVDSNVFDPFCGSGTVLAESARRGLHCAGIDINPAAFLFASMHRFSNLHPSERNSVISEAEAALAPTLLSGLFASGDHRHDTIDRLEHLSGYSLLFASVVCMIASGDGPLAPSEKMGRAFRTVHNTVMDMPFSKKCVRVEARDSRYTEFGKHSFDIAITSPPYINVFNYHQNYRPVVEALGWQPLRIATAEIGANRKHRQNRFKTVVQYPIDMAFALNEMRRVIKPDGVIILVVGRSSSVRRVAFPNAVMLALVAEVGLDMRIESWRERKFLNRYGETIYEDILAIRTGSTCNECDPESVGRAVGEWALVKGAESAFGDAKLEILQALESIHEIRPSSPTRVEVPNKFLDRWMSE